MTLSRNDEIVEILLTGEPLALPDPYVLYAELRASGPLHYGDHGLWVQQHDY